MPTRDELRRRLRSERAALSADEQARRSAEIARHVIRSALFNRATHVAVYIPCRGEVDPLPVAAAARARGKRLYLPVLDPAHPHRLWFLPWHARERLQPNRYGIPEPVAPRGRRVSPRHLDLVLAPLVGFDRHGNRLGMGGGYYDTTFAFLAQRRHWQKPRLLGMAYAFQEVDDLTPEPWDVPLTAIATESGIFRPRGE
ncbi:5-formyltetrahydrofolate cyclo-ligase [Thioalkalivibrio denitrificans]|uniref:5-formyltetrahydrofolate cyclo-ligase n=1 Tax=Thioalkalivibrio denitrificans TaxID=108003 RepID=A0A1V3NI69_9GAMM|nr:5-formyltetrahydrofolate cyclo-ligase [Thioalkalivibrio denitrificans]OOG24799.1 5-formyltetrahydrofolate cyclo-ligase [Thioalkalivibrio denitrificans]